MARHVRLWGIHIAAFLCMCSPGAVGCLVAVAGCRRAAWASPWLLPLGAGLLGRAVCSTTCRFSPLPQNADVRH